MAGIGRSAGVCEGKLLSCGTPRSGNNRGRRDSFGAGTVMPKSTSKHSSNKHSSTKLSHYDSTGKATMVDVSAKKESHREAEASAFVEMSAEVLRALPPNQKGQHLEVARFAGISAAKKTSELIPMCHQLPLSFVDVTTEVCENGVQVRSRAVT